MIKSFKDRDTERIFAREYVRRLPQTLAIHSRPRLKLFALAREVRRIACGGGRAYRRLPRRFAARNTWVDVHSAR